MNSGLWLPSAQCQAWVSTCHSSVPGCATPCLWQVSKSQQVYRSIPWDSFNGDTWSGPWIKEEMKDHPLRKQHSTRVTVTHKGWLIPGSALKWTLDVYIVYITPSILGLKTVACSIGQPADETSQFYEWSISNQSKEGHIQSLKTFVMVNTVSI